MKWVYENLVEVIEDENAVGGFSYQCKKCPRSFKFRIEAVRHASTCGTQSKAKKRGKNKRMHTCNLCAFKASTRAKLSKDRIIEHKDLHQSVNYTTCEKSYKTVKSLKQHMKQVHIQSKMCKCNMCPMVHPILDM